MGWGAWNEDSFKTYSLSKGMSVDRRGRIEGNYSEQEMFTKRCLDDELNPKNVIRECVDSEEHPNTIPVILALDVTGSMGQTAVEVAKQLNVVMTKLYNEVKDIEFMIMGIGDLAYDDAPIQVSQFESDIRIAEQLDKIYFEHGGGGNQYESYTAAWYFGARHTKLDCWNRGKKGIIITMGDEYINPYLPNIELSNVTGDNLQADIKTKDLYKEVKEKFDIFHIVVDHFSLSIRNANVECWESVLNEDEVKVSTVDSIANDIVDIILSAVKNDTNNYKPPQNETVDYSNGISW